MTRLIHTSGTDHISSELFSSGPETFTITGITETLVGDKERHAVQLKELNGKTWVPAFTVLKALAAVWGMEKEGWAGQRLTLYRDPKVKIGKEVVGGIRVSHITGIDAERTVKVKGAMNRPVAYTFKPLKDTPPQPDPIEQSLRDAWNDPARLQKAVKWMADNQHPLHQKAADRLAEIQETGEVES